MGKAKKNTGKRKKKAKQDAYVQAVVFIILSILLAVLIYAQTGPIGRGLSVVLGGLIGWIKYIIPVGTFMVGITLTRNSKKDVVPKITQYLIIILCICGIISLSQISNGTIDAVSGFSPAVADAYKLGTENVGGGALGAILAVPLNNTIGVAAYVLLVGACILLIIFTFGIDLGAIIKNISDRMQEEEEYEEEEEEIEEKTIPKKKKKEKKKKHSVIMDLLEEDEEIEEKERRRYEHDIPLAFEEEEEKHERDSIKSKLQEQQETKPEKEEEKGFIEANLFKEKKEEREEKTKQELQLEHAQIEIEQNYEFPPIEILEQGGPKKKGGKTQITDNVIKLEKTLKSFGVEAKVEDVSIGPAITRYELKPAEGVSCKKIANLTDDIALNLAAQSIRIEAPIPGKQAVGIEIPNQTTEMVHLRDVIDSEEFANSNSKLSVGLGKDISGARVVTDLSKMPHLLVAGATGSGKSVCINTIIASIIYKAKPSEVKLLMIDPKVVELSVYNGIPHLLIPVVTDPKKAAGALAWAVQEMEDRYAKFAQRGVRNIKGYNQELENEGEETRALKMPEIVIIVDELADLMMAASKDVEESIARIAQKARAAGMYLVIATQRPSVDVITGLIKANIPSRIAFAVSSGVDSKTILDMVGAEKLLGKGDMLFFPAGVPKPTRIQGAFVSDKEVEKIVDFLKKDGQAVYNEDLIETIENANKTDKEKEIQEDEDDDTDPRLNEAIDYVLECGTASASFLQRKMKVGYARAGRLIDQIAERGIISGYQGSKPREVLMTKERWAELNSEPSSQQSEEVVVAQGTEEN